MNSINPILIEFLLRSAVKNLPAKKREIYQYIESRENELEEVALNETHFIQLMNEKSPFKEAAVHFSVDILAIIDAMNEAQAEIDRVIKERCNRMKWIDCTELQRSKHKLKDNKLSFIFVS
ncbi:hypothetical protein [Niallia sp. 01092]|uniref:hypothetical protein n=1 Tax=unclassified Niallia TaxID=2837522 RepID=UPI003FCEFDB9